MRQQREDITNRVTREDVAERLQEEYPNASITYYEASHSNGRYRWQQIYVSGTRAASAIYRREETLLFLMIYEEPENAPLLALGMNQSLSTGVPKGRSALWSRVGSMPHLRRRDVRLAFSHRPVFTGLD
jgi:hypothetical protein